MKGQHARILLHHTCAVVIFALTSPFEAARISSYKSLILYKCLSLLLVVKTSAVSNAKCVSSHIGGG